MNKDLDTLRKVAEAATLRSWEAEPYLYGVDDDGRIRVTSPYDRGSYNLAESVLPHDAEHIATFDLPTVIELIEQVEYYKRKNETLSALGKANHDWNMKNRAELTEQLGQAEQAVARVRGFAESMGLSMSKRYVSQSFLSDKIIRLLDGDQALNGESNE